MYTIDFDPQRLLLRIVASGLWSPATAASFTATLLAKGTAWRLRYGQFAVLTDAREAAIQPPAIINALEAMMPQALKITSAPIAQVVGSHLAKLQSERYLKAENCRVFFDIDEALTWIDARRQARPSSSPIG